MQIGIRVNYPLFLSDFNEILNFIERFSKNTQRASFKKIFHYEPTCSTYDKDNGHVSQFYEIV